MTTEREMSEILQSASGTNLMSSQKSEEVWERIAADMKLDKRGQKKTRRGRRHILSGIAAVAAILIVAIGSYTLLRNSSERTGASSQPIQQLPQTEQKTIHKTLDKLKTANFPVKMPASLPYRVKNGRIKVSYMPQHPSKVSEVDIFFGNSPRELTIFEVKANSQTTADGQKVKLGRGGYGYYLKNGARSVLSWKEKGVLLTLSSYTVNNKTSPPSSKPDLNKKELIQIADSFQ